MKPRIYNSEFIDNLFKKDNNAIDMPKYLAVLLKNILFKKVSVESNRCVSCDARNLCGEYFKCKCKSILEQYKLRRLWNWIYKLIKK